MRHVIMIGSIEPSPSLNYLCTYLPTHVMYVGRYGHVQTVRIGRYRTLIRQLCDFPPAKIRYLREVGKLTLLLLPQLR